MGTPSNALQAAIYTRLTGFAPLTSLIAGVYDNVPENAHPPYVLIGDDTAIDDSTKLAAGWEATVTIHAWDFEQSGRKSVKAILSAIYDALHRQEDSIPIAGFRLIQMQWEFEQTFQDTSPEGESDHFYHGVQRYRAIIETN
jgi:hypothetical protein